MRTPSTKLDLKQIISNVPQPGRLDAMKGVFAPEPELLENGDYIYRFASHGARLGYQAGRWWIKKEDFDNILARATRSGMDLGQKARWGLAVLQKWGSRMNIVVEARVSSKLWAWTGLAKPQLEQSPNGKVIRMFGNPTIRQLFLYNVVDQSGMLTSIGREALKVTGAKVIVSTSIY